MKRPVAPTNIFIKAKSPTYFIVTADTERFGRGEVMFEGNTWEQCFSYVKRLMGKTPEQGLLLRAYVTETVADREGREYPFKMKVNG